MLKALMAGVVVTVAFVVAGCGALNIQPSAEVTTMSPAWPNWFRFDYAVEEDKGGKRRISGYLHNNYGEAADDVRILIQALDKSGAVVGQQLNWAASVPPMSRSYFEARNLPAADQYRLSVWAFTFDQRTSWE
ncbi:MAG: hypothetical protein HYU41_11350 [Candidatus Rokubacteria bacterium]|nr:hypothetical protein [Candidatus Rokubacteria bacterium]